MQEKEELKKQVIVLAIILVFVIIVAIIFNLNTTTNTKNKQINKQNETTQNQTNTNNNQQEMLNNLKGLIEQPPEEEILDTSEAKSINTNSGESIQYLETEYEE